MSESPDLSLELETIACPLCGSGEYKLLFVGHDPLYHIPGEFPVVRCAECRHVYLNPRPTLADITKCYPDHYGPYQTGEQPAEQQTGEAASVSNVSAEQTKRPWYLNRWAKGIPGLKPLYHWLMNDRAFYFPEDVPAPRTALDVGCSSGGLLEKLRQRDWDAEGVEIAEAPAQTARERGFRVHTGTLESAGFESGRFDAVFALMVLEHLHDPQRALAEIHRILAERGQLIFSVPNFACWERLVFRGYWRGLELPRHLQHFTPRVLRQLLKEVGFDDIRILHQSNTNNIVASIGLWLRDYFPRQTWGQRLLDFTDNPRLAGTLLLAPLAKLLALVRQGGRLTVVARKVSPG